MKYQSGEEIQQGDKVLYAGKPAEIKLVVDKLTGDAERDWLMKEFGPGVAVQDRFVTDTQNAEDLVLVSRRNRK